MTSATGRQASTPTADRRAASAGRRVRGLPAGMVLAACLAVTVGLTPLVYLAVRTAQAGAARVAAELLTVRTAALAARSVGLAAVVTLACLVIGVALAFLVVRTDLPGRRLFGVVAALPLAIPTYVAGFAWLAALPRFEGFWPAALVLTLCSYPYVYLPVAAALAGTDPAQEEVSRSLGRGVWRTFSGVILRQLRPALASGGLLVALYVFSDFGAVSLLRYDTFTRAIFTKFNLGFDRTGALVLSTTLVALTALLLFAESLARHRARYARLSGAIRPPLRIRLGRMRWPTTLVPATVAGLSLGVPAVSLTGWLVSGVSRPEPVSAILTAAGNSLWVSLLGATGTLVLALPIGLLAARHSGTVPQLLERASYAGHALPGLVIGLSLVFFAVTLAYPLYQTTGMLALGYSVLFLPLAVAAVRAAAGQSPPGLEEVARSLGRGPLHVLRTVTLPLTAPGIGAGAALVFLTCMKELPATLMLRPTGMDTLATELWTKTDVAAYAGAAPYAALLVILAAVPTWLLAQRTGVWSETSQ
jgi:iron(III) transport system permease protein